MKDNASKFDVRFLCCQPDTYASSFHHQAFTLCARRLNRLLTDWEKGVDRKYRVKKHVSLSCKTRLASSLSLSKYSAVLRLPEGEGLYLKCFAFRSLSSRILATLSSYPLSSNGTNFARVLGPLVKSIRWCRFTRDKLCIRKSFVGNRRLLCGYHS